MFFFLFLHIQQAFVPGLSLFLICAALLCFCWQGFVSKNGKYSSKGSPVKVRTPQYRQHSGGLFFAEFKLCFALHARWCSQKQDELYSLKHCRRRVCLLLINLKLSCWVCLVWYDIISATVSTVGAWTDGLAMI